MSEPILHKRQISASIKQVCGNGVLQAMELALLHWQPCDLSIRLHEMVEHVAAYRYPTVAQNFGEGVHQKVLRYGNVRSHSKIAPFRWLWCVSARSAAGNAELTCGSGFAE